MTERMQAPASQVSVVQALPSSQSAAVAQRWQPGMTESWQLPSVPQASVVQGSWSLQSAAAVQGVQPAWGWCSQTPFARSEERRVGEESVQPGAVGQGRKAGMEGGARQRASDVAGGASVQSVHS